MSATSLALAAAVRTASTHARHAAMMRISTFRHFAGFAIAASGAAVLGAHVAALVHL